MQSLEGTVQARSLGVMFEPPTLTLVYARLPEGKLRKRTMPVRRLHAQSDPKVIAKALAEAHPSLLAPHIVSLSQLERLIGKLVEHKQKQSGLRPEDVVRGVPSKSDAAKAAGAEEDRSSSSARLDTAQLVGQSVGEPRELPLPRSQPLPGTAEATSTSLEMPPVAPGMPPMPSRGTPEASSLSVTEFHAAPSAASPMRGGAKPPSALVAGDAAPPRPMGFLSNPAPGKSSSLATASASSRRGASYDDDFDDVDALLDDIADDASSPSRSSSGRPDDQPIRSPVPKTLRGGAGQAAEAAGSARLMPSPSKRSPTACTASVPVGEASELVSRLGGDGGDLNAVSESELLAAKVYLLRFCGPFCEHVLQCMSS